MKSSLLILAFTTLLFSQSNTITETVIEHVSQKLIAEAIISYGGEYQSGSHCYKNEEGIILSCFSVETDHNWITDFDNDGDSDLLVRFTDEGLGGGGNAYGYDYKIVLLKNGEIIETFDIFGGGKYSETNLTINAVYDGGVYATQTINRFSYPEATDDQEESLHYSLIDGELVEE